jgi:hypothetical protein
MEGREAAFVWVMVAIAVVGVAAFLIYLLARYARSKPGEGAEGAPRRAGPRWFEYLLAIVLLVVVFGVLIWQLAVGGSAGLAASDWRTGDRSQVFFWLMVVLAAVALVVFIIFLLTRIPQRERAAAGAAVESAAEQPGVETPSGARLLGLLVLGLAFLLLNWIYLARAQQYALMLNLLYPASLAVALVLLFDKATRAWSVKSTAETVREWLFCDAIVFILILGFLNLMELQAGEAYAAMFWDFLFIALFFFVFWLVDRKVTRYRFLVAHGYLIVLPILLLIWRVVQEVPAPEPISWWETIWPVFFLAIIFFVLEIIVLIATAVSEKQVIPAIKDAIFFIAYGILLIVAVPEAPA